MSLVASVVAGFMAFQSSASQPLIQDMTRVDDIVVSARSDADHIRSFLDDISLPERSLNTARFFQKVCVGVVNLRPDAAQLIADRVSFVAEEIGLKAGEPGCTPNILVIASNDGRGLAQGLVRRSRRAFDPGASGMVRSRRALQVFQTGDAPIRWWHVSVPIDAHTGSLAVRQPGEDAPVVTGSNSRLRSELRHDIARVIVIVDLSKLDAMHFGQVADYVSMVSLSQVDADGDFEGYDSILSLLSDNRQIQGLTEWDEAYLKALYSAELNQVAKSHQQGEIARLMEAVRNDRVQPESK